MVSRNLSQEAHLWYTISSPEYIAQAKNLLQKARVFMRERVQKHPFISDYAPVPHWGGVMEDLVIRFDNALGMLKQGDFDAMQRWAGRLQDIPRGFGESNMNWLSPADQDAFMQMLNSTYSICSEFLGAVAMSAMYSDPSYKDQSGDWHHDIPEDMGIEGSCQVPAGYKRAS